MAETSTKPYMIRALYEWCCDNGYTPYLAVSVDAHTLVPRQHVKNGEIVLNVSPMATSRLSLGNDLVEFQARFSGVAQQISVPIGNISAIYARETGHGMAFEVAVAPAEDGDESTELSDGEGGGGQGSEGGAGRLQAVPEDGGHHTQGSTVQSLRGGAHRRGPRSLTAEDTAGTADISDTARAREDAASARSDEEGSQGGKSEGSLRESGAGEGAPGGDAGATPAPSRRRSARSKESADVIAFAPSGGAGKKKAADKGVGSASSAAKPEGSVAAVPADAPSSDGDEDPPPTDGGAGKSGKARLTRVK